MDELISRKAVIECVWKPKVKPDAEIFNALQMVIQCAIEQSPTVEAVPIEPLCVWLAAYAAPPKYAMNAVAGDPIAPKSCSFPVNSRVEAWKYHFRELLKSGLMDMEDEDARP